MYIGCVRFWSKLKGPRVRRWVACLHDMCVSPRGGGVVRRPATRAARARGAGARAAPRANLLVTTRAVVERAPRGRRRGGGGGGGGGFRGAGPGTAHVGYRDSGCRRGRGPAERRAERARARARAGRDGRCSV